MARTALLTTVAVLATGLIAADSGVAEHNRVERVSTGPSGGNGQYDHRDCSSTLVPCAEFSDDGTRLFFESDESLTPADTDSQADVYLREAGLTTLVSTGPNGGNGTHPSRVLEASADGRKAFFNTAESLVAEDTDAVQDIYRWENGTLTLITLGPDGGNGPHNVGVCGAGPCFFVIDLVSDAGDRVTFTTAESLVSTDTDSAIDVYQWSSGVMRQISAGNSSHLSRAVKKTADHSNVFFETQEPLLPGADDRALYRWNTSGTTLVTNSNSAVENSGVRLWVSPDGERVWFATPDALDPADLDGAADVYVVQDGTPSLISKKSDGSNGSLDVLLQAVSSDGSRVIFNTGDKMTPADQDGDCQRDDGEGSYYFVPCEDVYERAAGSTTLVSTGPSIAHQNFDAWFQAATPDAAHVYFSTREPLLSPDTNGKNDIYERAGGTTTQVSVGPAGSSVGPNLDGFILLVMAVAPDASRVVFWSGENLVPADADQNEPLHEEDLYERSGNRTTLLAPPTSDFSEWFVASTPDVRHVLISSWIAIDPADSDVCPPSSSPNGRCLDLYDVSVVPRQGYLRPKSANQVRLPLVPAARQCTSPNRTHGPPLAFPSCNPPTLESSHVTVGGDGSPAFARSTGLVGLDTKPAAPGGPDDADVDIRFALTNVTWTSGLTDYTGEVEASLGIRLTDADPGAPAYYPPATTQDLPFAFTIPCTATASDLDGSTCALRTSAEAVLPGSVTEGARSIWSLDQVQVTDGGPDGDVDTNDNSVVARQGIFVP